MADIFTKKQRSKNMSLIRSENTKPEIKVRKWLFKKGLRYRLHYNVPGKPDIVFPCKKTAIFVNGCFWHKHGCKLSTPPKSNMSFWNEKLEKNHIRDIGNYKKLKLLQWKVILIWQCKINTKARFDSRMNGVYKSLIN